MTPKRDTILVAGSANLDFVVRAPHVPAPGETVLGGEFTTFPGGKGANQAVAASRAGGARTRMLVALGDDPYAEPLERSLRDAGVEPQIVRSQNHATGIAFIVVSDAAENAITVAPGANLALRAQDLPALDRVSHLLLQLETPRAVVEAYAQAARAAGVKVVLNAAPARPLPQSLLAAVDVLIVNEGELAALGGDTGTLAQRLAHVAHTSGTATVIVTLGVRGACARVGDEYVLQPSFPVVPVDTTGAGDTFCGAFVASLARGADTPAALRFASAAGALACTKLGAQTGVPHRADVDAMLAAMRDDSTARAELAAYCGLF
ncbi:ribokinase [Tahibacter soli]|uniref:Ribokinase n=1 Tax=Tahibacter soli TaxID=2983605 RepID=A0A9X3YNK8_9GAMM|nr:ribokinase [Tahibacter soli]MDC8014972.1 ribokinase [Tahibacter soli]